MFAYIKQYISSSINASFLYRGITLFALLLVFATGLKAQRYYVIYYDDAGTRYYLSINADGRGLERTTNLSLNCYWQSEGALSVAQGKRGSDIYNSQNSSYNNYNESNRKPLNSFVFPNKFLVGVNTGNDQGPASRGDVQDLNVSTSSSNRWMIDNEFPNNTLVFYYWNYKQYTYYDNGWKYSSKGYEKVKSPDNDLVKIAECYLLPIPTITIAESGDGYLVSITASDDCEIYYTTDGSDPTLDSDNLYETSFTASKNTTIKAVAVKEKNSISAVAEMFLPESMTVTLDDREKHSWTYYRGVDKSVDNENYNNYKGLIYSPNPRDVQITYTANGGAVSISEPENEFVYYKTLEQSNNQYTYTTIDNPFSKRPSNEIIGADHSSTKQLLGFAGWKIKSITGGSIIGYNNNIIPAGQEITFNFTSTYSINSISAEVVLEATWEEPNVTYLSDVVQDDNTNYEFSITKATGATTYENNFLVINKNYSGTITVNSPCTITMVEPDGSKDYREYYTFTGAIVPFDNTPQENAKGKTKIEFAHWNPTAAIDAYGRNFTIGRGMKMDGETRILYGSSAATQTVDQVLKVGSGRFSELRHYAENGDYGDRVTRQWVTLGCDYDRAKRDNTKLEFTGSMYVGHYCKLNLDPTDEMCRVYGLSGKFMGDNPGAASYLNCYYMSVSDEYNQGHRYLEIQGGEWLNIAGGTNNYAPNTSQTAEENTTVTEDAKIAPTFTFRMKGGLVKGSVYGGAEYYNAVGTRTFVITGGTIKGWIAGGANGTRMDGGQLYGNSYLYVGGNARVDSNPDSNASSNTIINRAVGGNVFGAGCGYDAESTSGQVTLGTNVVIADNAYVERGVYGGGSYGFCSEDKASNIYITGGTIDGKIGGVEAIGDSKKYITTINGGVYGGACQNKGGNVNIYMTGGTVNGGIYGGSNASGEVEGPINLKMTGGTVENIFGGGNEAPVKGNTNVTITGGEVKQNVYGGGNKATVSGTTNVVIGQ